MSIFRLPIEKVGRPFAYLLGLNFLYMFRKVVVSVVTIIMFLVKSCNCLHKASLESEVLHFKERKLAHVQFYITYETCASAKQCAWLELS